VGPRRLPFLKTLLALLALILLLLVTRGLWLAALGRVLVHDDGPAKAEVAVLLAGDSWGFRMDYAAQLVKRGYVPKVLVSGPPGLYGINEADAAVRWAVQRGYPADWFVPIHHHALSTRDESVVLVNYMREHGIRGFLLVTSNYHTARARRIFRNTERKLGGGPDFRVAASNDKYYSPETWWKTREGLKLAFMEWAKTLTGAFGI